MLIVFENENNEKLIFRSQGHIYNAFYLLQCVIVCVVFCNPTAIW